MGSKDTTEQTVLGEIVAQHLEHRLGRKVVRNLGLGNTPIVYQAFSNGEIGIYPEETGTIETLILKEPLSVDAANTLDRVRSEMHRTARGEVLDPLGIDNGWAVVISKNADDQNNLETIGDAAGSKRGWKPGITRDFNERADGLAMLNRYRLPMRAIPFVGDPASLYEGLASGNITMVVGNLTDGPLARHPEWRVLRDDKKTFGYYQTCLLAQSDLLADDPKIQPALAELSGKFTNADMLRMNAEVGIDHKTLADVARQFLAQAGLK